MKNYANNRAQKGKTAFRTQDRFIYRAAKLFWKNKLKKNKPKDS